MCVRERVHACMCAWVRACVHVCVHVCMCAFMCACMCACVRVCVRACVCACVLACVRAYVPVSWARRQELSRAILINKFSDHQPYFICLNTISYEGPPPKYIKVTTQSYEAISNFANEIINSDILERLNKTSNADPNTNYNILHDSIERAKEAHLPDKIVKFKKHKHKKNGWITSGILRSIKHRDGMYKKLKSEKPNSHNNKN